MSEISDEFWKRQMDELVKTGGPAFPSAFELANGATVNSHGMTVRDYFAGQMLARIGIGWPNEENRAILAKQAYEMADAMLAYRLPSPSTPGAEGER